MPPQRDQLSEPFDSEPLDVQSDGAHEAHGTRAVDYRIRQSSSNGNNITHVVTRNALLNYFIEVSRPIHETPP